MTATLLPLAVLDWESAVPCYFQSKYIANYWTTGMAVGCPDTNTHTKTNTNPNPTDTTNPNCPMMQQQTNEPVN